jgi:hypothetical protein
MLEISWRRPGAVGEELRDDATTNDSKCRVGHRFATYSNSNPTVVSYILIFETLWPSQN